MLENNIAKSSFKTTIWSIMEKGDTNVVDYLLAENRKLKD